MRIYRYLFKEVMMSFMAVAIVLVMIFVTSRFVKYLADAAAGIFSSEVLFSVMLFRLPGFLEMILPLALFIGIMLTYGRLFVESEIIVMQACGFSKKQLLICAMAPALLVMIMVSLLTVWITPLGSKHFHQIWNDPKTYSGLGTLVPGNFKKLSKSDSVIYTASMNDAKTQLNDVFIVRSSKNENGQTIHIIKSERAEIEQSGPDEKFIIMKQGKEYRGKPDQPDFIVSNFSLYGQRLTEPKSELVNIDEVDAQTTLKLASDSDLKAQAAFYWRLSFPFLIPVSALIALALSETTHRRGRYIKLLPGIILYLFYIAAFIGTRSEVEDGKLNPAIAFWLVHFVFFVIGWLLLYFRDIKVQWAYMMSKR